MTRISTLALLPALGFAAQPGAAWAQTTPDIQDLVVQGEQINRSVEGAVERDSRRSGEDAAIDGEAGVYVLTVNRIFQVSASAGLGYTDNPTRTADDVGNAAYGDFSLAGGIATRLGNRVDFGLSANVGGREFFDAVGPSSRTVSATASLGMPIVGPVYAGIVAFGGYSFDNEFENGTSFHGVSGNLSAALPVTEGVVLRPGLGATRQWSAVSENNSSMAAASLDLLGAISPSVTASLRVTAARRWYDDFYEDVTFVERRDMIYGIAASIAWRPAPFLAVVATISFDNQDSTFFLSNFQAVEGGVGASLHYRF